MTGKVFLVGAGPGDPDLLTIKARRVIDHADVILHDSLTGDEIVESVPPNARILDVGKKSGPGGTRTTQREINHAMVQHARADRIVARLKGGDPTVFGRGGEEAEYLAEAGVNFEIVPGVSSIVAAPGLVGIPVTHRHIASSITVITGHENPRKDDSAIDWPAITTSVESGGTLLILMGVRTLADNVHRLRECGLPAETPIALIEKASWAEETAVTGTLKTIVAAAEAADIEPPAVTVVGEVVELRERVKEQLVRDGEGDPAGVPLAPARTEFGERTRHSPVSENP